MNNQYNPTEYTQYLLNHNKSQNTIQSYLADLNQYYTIYPTIDRSNIIQYKLSLSRLSPTSINRKLSSLKQYNEYLLDTAQVSEVYVLKSDYTRIQSTGNPTNVAEQTVLDFLNDIISKPCTNHKAAKLRTRNIAIAHLMANTGIRRAECCSIKLEDIDIAQRELHITKGKGNKYRTVGLNDTAIKSIVEYLADRKQSKYNASPYLFVSERAPKLHISTINNIFEKYDTKVNPHALRHNYGSTMYENGILTLIEIKDQLGHSSLSTTEIYTHARQGKIKQKINNYNIGSLN